MRDLSLLHKLLWYGFSVPCLGRPARIFWLSFSEYSFNGYTSLSVKFTDWPRILSTLYDCEMQAAQIHSPHLFLAPRFEKYDENREPGSENSKIYPPRSVKLNRRDFYRRAQVNFYERLGQFFICWTENEWLTQHVFAEINKGPYFRGFPRRCWPDKMKRHRPRRIVGEHPNQTTRLKFFIANDVRQKRDTLAAYGKCFCKSDKSRIR